MSEWMNEWIFGLGNRRPLEEHVLRIFPWGLHACSLIKELELCAIRIYEWASWLHRQPLQHCQSSSGFVPLRQARIWHFAFHIQICLGQKYGEHRFPTFPRGVSAPHYALILLLHFSSSYDYDGCVWNIVVGLGLHSFIQFL